MIGANISPDSILSPSETLRTEGAVTWNGPSSSVVCGRRTIRFRSDTQPVIPKVLRKLVEKRKKNRARYPSYAAALEVAVNSIYGSLSYEFSPLYSPSCSAATTAFGRWCLSLSIGVFELCGLEVLYGDTDLCFLTSTDVTRPKFRGNLRDHCTVALKILKRVLYFTPFQNMDIAL